MNIEQVYTWRRPSISHALGEEKAKRRQCRIREDWQASSDEQLRHSSAEQRVRRSCHVSMQATVTRSNLTPLPQGVDLPDVYLSLHCSPDRSPNDRNRSKGTSESSSDTRPRRGDLSPIPAPNIPRLLASMRDFLGFDAHHLDLSGLRCRFAA